MIYISLAIVVTAIFFFVWKVTVRSQYESADYTVLESKGVFQIREYPYLMMVTTNMNIESQGDDGSFRRLFRYISGENETGQKLAMTTPVLMQPDKDVLGDRMGFIIPKRTVKERVPKPSNNQVQIRERRGGRFAVIRFNGRLTNDKFTAAETRLRSWMLSQDLLGEVYVESAGYDPPWTPGLLRRNEILIRLR
jgi:hypothetical protein